MAEISKAKHAFNERFYRFDEDLELVDYLSNQIRSGVLSPKESLFTGDISKYERLTKRSQNTTPNAFKKNREVLSTHLKKTLYSSYIKDSYEEVTDYIKVILGNAAVSKTVDVKRFIGNHSKIGLSGAEILELGDFTKLTHSLIDKIFQSLEGERSTLNLVKTVCDKLGFKENTDLITKTVQYLNIRHYLVHSNGVLPEEFLQEARKNGVNIQCDNKKCLKLNYEFIREFRSAVSSLIEYIDSEIIKGDFLEKKFIHKSPK